MIGPRSWIFGTVVRFAFFVINAFAAYLFLRGHNAPGGGFIAGLASAAALVLLSLVLGLEKLHRLIRVDPVRIAAAGLLLAIICGLAPVLGGGAYLTQFNWHLHNVPLLGELHLGTPLLFDLGVYLVVIGITCKIIFVLAQSTQGMPGLVAEEERRYSSPLEEPIEEPQAGGKEADDAN
jgi:multicomponent Na+:H+ antiporter subunit B